MGGERLFRRPTEVCRHNAAAGERRRGSGVGETIRLRDERRCAGPAAHEQHPGAHGRDAPPARPHQRTAVGLDQLEEGQGEWILRYDGGDLLTIVVEYGARSCLGPWCLGAGRS